MTEASASPSAITRLPALFHALPAETQHAVLSVLTSRDHLYALSLSSRYFNSLSVEHLFRDIWFDPLDSDDSVYRTCSTAHLGTEGCAAYENRSPGHRDRYRWYGSSEYSTLFRGLSETCFPQLESIHFKIHDVEDDEISTLRNIFKSLANNTANFPVLCSIALEGYWELANSERTRSAFKAIKNWLAGLPSLRRIELSYLTISKDDLTSLLTGIELTHLSLEEIEPLTWQECLEAIPPAARKTLRILSLGLPDNNVSHRSVMLQTCLPALGRLDIQMHRYATTGRAHASILSLFSSILRPTTRSGKKVTGSSQAILPSLQVLGVADAIHLLADGSRCSPQLFLDTLVHVPTSPIKHVVLTRDTTSLPASTVQTINEARSYLHSNGIQTHSAPRTASSIDEDENDSSRYTAYASHKVVYINRDLRNGHAVDPEYAAMADAAAEALAKAHGATLL